MDETRQMVERVAKAISGAPFPSPASLRKAETAIEAYKEALAEAGMVIVSSGIAEAMEDARRRSEEFRRECDERRARIRGGVRGPGARFKL